jgi:hypothetical protein
MNKQATIEVLLGYNEDPTSAEKINEESLETAVEED